MLADAGKLETLASIKVSVAVDTSGLGQLSADVAGIESKNVVIGTTADETGLNQLKTDLAAIPPEEIPIELTAPTPPDIATAILPLDAIPAEEVPLIPLEPEAGDISTALLPFEELPEEDVPLVPTAPTDMEVLTALLPLEMLPAEEVQIEPVLEDAALDIAFPDEVISVSADVNDENLAMVDSVLETTLADEVVEVDTQEGSDNDAVLDDIKGSLNTLKNLALIGLVIDVATALLDIQAVYDALVSLPGVKTIISLDEAMGLLESHMDPAVWDAYSQQAQADLEDLYIAVDGFDQAAIASQMVLASQMEATKDSIKEATELSLNFADTWDADPAEVLKTMNSLVETGLVPNLEAAVDLMTAGMQAGANKGGDLLSTLQQNAALLKEMGFSGQETMNLINSGFDNGFTSAQRTVQELVKFNTQLDANKDKATEALGTLGLADPKDTGGKRGATFFDAVLDGIKKQGQDKQGEITQALFGAKQGTGTEAVLNLTATQDTLGALEGRAAAAADAIDNTLGAKINDMSRRFDITLGRLLSSDQINLDQKLDDLKGQIDVFMGDLEQGATLGAAFEVAFQVPGVEQGLKDFTVGIGNIFLDMMAALADILDFVGQDDAARNIRTGVSQQATVQLQYDLINAKDEDAVAGAVSRAMKRGVDNTNIGIVTQQAIDEALQKGDVQAAQTILDTVNASFETNPVVAKIIADKGSVEAAKAYIDEFVASGGGEGATAGDFFEKQFGVSPQEAQDQINAALALKDVDTSESEAKVREAAGKLMAAYQDELKKGRFDSAAAMMKQLGMDDFQMNTQLAQAKKKFGSGTDIAGLGSGDKTGVSTVDKEFDKYKDQSADARAAMDDTQKKSGDTAAVVKKDVATSTANVKKANTDIAASADETTTKVKDSADKMSVSFSTIADTAEEALPRAIAAYDAFSDAVLKRTDEMIKIITELLGDINTVADKTQPAQAGAGGAQAHARGGKWEGWSTVGEEGTELLYSGGNIGVINAATSDQIVSTLAAMLHGGAGGGGNTYQQNKSMNNNFTFITQSSAQTNDALARTSAAARGY